MNQRTIIKVFTEDNHSKKKNWVNFLIHPIRAYWGDGTLDWYKYESDFNFYKSIFIICNDIKNADVAFLPLTLNYYLLNKKLFLVNKFIIQAKRNNLKTYIWVEGDYHVRFLTEDLDCTFIRYFSYRSKLIKNEIIMPGDLKTDLLKFHYNGKFQVKKKSKIPIIGFDGLAKYPLKKFIKLIIKNIFLKLTYNLHFARINQDHIIPYLINREKILINLKNSRLLDTNFNIRNSFAIGTIGKQKELRNQFLNNIISSDYTFCYRSNANYSLRFYETLCLGRIPLFINTDCKLPFENDIDWKNLCIWIEESDVKYIPEIILDFHNSHTESQMIDKQVHCREIWLKYLSKKGFYNHFYKFLPI